MPSTDSAAISQGGEIKGSLRNEGSPVYPSTNSHQEVYQSVPRRGIKVQVSAVVRFYSVQLQQMLPVVVDLVVN